MDRGLQERLVGAAVLVALGVWLIPWVLDGSAGLEQSSQQAVALKLPAPEAAGGGVVRRQTIELNAERGAGVKSHTTEASAPSGAEHEPPRRAAETGTDTGTDTGAAEASAGDTTQAARAAPPAESVASEQTPEHAPEASTTTALANIIAASPVAGWMVQLGSFSDAGNAQRQAQRVGTYGHDARIYEFAAAGGRTMFRVRVGPHPSRERAAATASSLAAHGFVAQLVAPE